MKKAILPDRKVIKIPQNIDPNWTDELQAEIARQKREIERMAAGIHYPSISFTRLGSSVRIRVKLEDDKELAMLVDWEALHEIFFHMAASHSREYSLEIREE